MAPTPVFSCEICKMFKNIYFEEHLRTTASKKKIDWGHQLLDKTTQFLPLHPSVLYGW